MQAPATPPHGRPSASRGGGDLLHALGALADAMAGARELPDVCRALFAFARQTTPADTILVATYDPVRQERTCVYSAGFGHEDDVAALPRLPLNDGPQSRALRAGTAVIVEDLEFDLRGKPAVNLGLDQDPRLAMSSLAMPMRARGEIVGVFELQSYELGAFAEEHVPACALAAEIGGLAAEIVRSSASSRQRSVVRADRRSLAAIVERSQFRPVFQPVVELGSRRVVGFEALTRFDDGSSPQERFMLAASVGLGGALEEATLRAALREADSLPSDVWLSLNVSPTMILTAQPLLGLVEGAGRHVVLEITEHAAVGDYELFRQAFAAFPRVVDLAIDDAGAGYASFRHILELRPRYVKLDRGLIRGLEADAARLALIAGLVQSARASGALLVAEGVETEDELEALRRLEVPLGQGYLFARPASATAFSGTPGTEIASAQGR